MFFTVAPYPFILNVPAHTLPFQETLPNFSRHHLLLFSPGNTLKQCVI
jgi:hypothetical protein